jgi:hypothetical protein
LDSLTEITEYGKDETSKIEVLRDVVLTLFNSLIDVRHCLVEIVLIEVEDGTKIEKGRYMVI